MNLENAGENTHNLYYEGHPWRSSYQPGVAHDIENLPYASIAAMLKESGKKYAQQKAFTTCLPNGLTASHTFAEIDALSDQFASYLRLYLGLKKGERVAIQLPNCPAYPVCAYGILKAGCTVVNINPLYTAPEMAHLLVDSGASVLIILDLFRNKLDKALPGTQVRTVIQTALADLFPLATRLLIKGTLKLTGKIPSTKVTTIPFPETLRLGNEELKKCDPWSSGYWGAEHTPETATALTLSDIAVLQYTGGTTGISKAAILTHQNILSNMYQLIEIGRPRLELGKEVILTALPMYHVFAFTINGITFFGCGAHNILIPSPKPISNLKKAFKKYNVTWVTGVNTLFNALIHEDWFQANPPQSIKVAIAGGAALQTSVASKWEQFVKTPLVEGYGLTEASPVVAFNPIGGRIKTESIGIPIPGTKIRVVDEAGNSVPIGSPGELVISGPQVMSGYWKRDDETAKVLKNNWLYTGDVATMDADGYLRIVDRKKDMILVSGFNVYPNEVEECLALHPDVKEVAVIGIPDEVTGEAVRAYVVSKRPDLTGEELRMHCRKFLTKYKVPKTYVFKSELPKSNVGKVLRKDLRQDAAQELERNSRPVPPPQRITLPLEREVTQP